MIDMDIFSLEKPAPGKIVKNVSNNKIGRTFNDKPEINGKIPVYYQTEKEFVFEEKGVLVSKEKILTIGFID